MKILAAFDGTPESEAAVPLLMQIAQLPNAEITLVSVAQGPESGLKRRGPRRPVVVADVMGRAVPVLMNARDVSYAENRGQAIDRRIAELQDYLEAIAGKLVGATSVHIESHVSDKPAEIIIERAQEEEADVIVMATHSHSGLTGTHFGSTAESVLRSGVAPVLLVHPKKGR